MFVTDVAPAAAEAPQSAALSGRAFAVAADRTQGVLGSWHGHVHPHV